METDTDQVVDGFRFEWQWPEQLLYCEDAADGHSGHTTASADWAY